MIVATISEAKKKLSAYVDRVRAGESVLIVDGGVPVARLDPVKTNDARIARLERAGILRPPRSNKKVSLEFLAQPLESGEHPAGVLDALLEERRDRR